MFFFFPYALLRVFTNDEAVVELGTVFLRIVAILQVPLALTMVLAGSLRGAGDTKEQRPEFDDGFVVSKGTEQRIGKEKE